MIRRRCAKRYEWVPHALFALRAPKAAQVITLGYGTRALLMSDDGSVTLPVNKVLRFLDEGPENSVHFYASNERQRSRRGAAGGVRRKGRARYIRAMTTSPFAPLRDLPRPGGWRPGDVLVLFGELFGRGYANGVLDAARRAGITVIGATVGRRDGNGPLRPLTAEERTQAEAALGGRIVNIPLEAGFDLDAAGDGPSPVEQLKGVKADAWEATRVDWELVDRSREAGARRFARNAEAFAAELAGLVPPGANVLFVHTMAGGFPRTRVYMPLIPGCSAGPATGTSPRRRSGGATSAGSARRASRRSPREPSTSSSPRPPRSAPAAAACATSPSAVTAARCSRAAPRPGSRETSGVRGRSRSQWA